VQLEHRRFHATVEQQLGDIQAAGERCLDRFALGVGIGATGGGLEALDVELALGREQIRERPRDRDFLGQEARGQARDCSSSPPQRHPFHRY